MVMTPAQRHVIRRRAQSDSSGTKPRARASQFDLMRAQLAEHRRSLKGIQSVERKADFKRDFLQEYAPYVETALESGEPIDEIVSTVMVWRIDTGDFAGALPIAEAMIEHGGEMPDGYQRNAGTVIAEDLANAFLKPGDDETERPALDLLERVGEITGEIDMPDPARAKLHKAIGYAQREAGHLEPALGNLERALQLNSRVGVKKDIERLQRELKNA
ncbi:phage terminase small subunit [Guyparkeria halopsychrophila]|uniref:phage terminase small subunit n=1 Tax=Guyparkeria halopsychrophila TaxID=3139421 RepID=UPI0037C76F0E